MATTVIRHFKFNDYGLAQKVRGKMLRDLSDFDVNKNMLFDSQQIRQAMMKILGETQVQVQYVVKNVFRYDRDGDNCVTYEQFTNFCVEHHFGQMAIQRLHRKGQYVNGSKRIMNLQEFQTTLNYCLGFIKCQGTHSEYQRLFNQVDLDHDGFISYQDYFIFLKQYFGSQSQPFINPKPEPVSPPINYIDGNGQTPQQRFAKLIYSQFKITVMQRDRNRNLLLEKQQVQDLLSNYLKINYNEKIQMTQKIFTGSNTVKYENFLRAAVTNYLSTIGAQKNFPGSSLNESQFIELINKLCHFVAIKPAQHILKACFKQSSRGSNTISQSDYTNLIRNIFENYKFDTRGLPRGKQNNQRFQPSIQRNYY